MKKYSVYEIEKLTDGKMSKYKINKAIEDGFLKAERIDDNVGKNSAKWEIYQDSLNEWLHSIGEQVKTKIPVPGEDSDTFIVKEELDQLVKERVSDLERIIAGKDNHITDLKNQVNLIQEINIPLLTEGKNYAQQQVKELKDDMSFLHQKNESQSVERRKLLMDLSNCGVFQIGKKRKLLSKLNEIS